MKQWAWILAVPVLISISVAQTQTSASVSSSPTVAAAGGSRAVGPAASSPSASAAYRPTPLAPPVKLSVGVSGSLANSLRSAGVRLEQASTEIKDLQALNQHVIDSMPSGLATTDAIHSRKFEQTIRSELVWRFNWWNAPVRGLY